MALAVGLFALFPLALRADDFSSLFDQANRLYDQSKFADAAAAYDQLIQAGHRSPTIYFNLGNASFKAGQNGRAIAAYRLAQNLAPRDPAVRFNLAFARQKVTGSETAPATVWQRSLASLTLNEWTVLAMCAVWGWFLLLALREWRVPLRKMLSGYTATAGVLAVLLSGCLAAAAYQRSRDNSAVVIVPNAVVRLGPLDESPVAFQLRDGSETSVLDEKELTVAGKKQRWLQVEDASTHRTGWLQRDQVLLLKSLPTKP